MTSESFYSYNAQWHGERKIKQTIIMITLLQNKHMDECDMSMNFWFVRDARNLCEGVASLLWKIYNDFKKTQAFLWGNLWELVKESARTAGAKWSSSSSACSIVSAARAGGAISVSLSVPRIWCLHWNVNRSAAKQNNCPSYGTNNMSHQSDNR